MARPSSYKTPAGATRYRIRFQVEGQTIDKAGFRTATDARAFQKEESARLRLRMRNTGKQTINELLDRYYAGPYLFLAPGTKKSRKTELEYWRVRLGTRKASEVTPAIIADEIERLRKRSGPLSSGSIRKYALALRAVFTIAMREWHLLQTNPFDRVKLPADGKARDRTLSDQELARLLQAVESSRSEYLKPAVMLALVTGARRGEILGLRWSDVDTARKRTVFKDTKNGTHRAALVTDSVLALLEELRPFTAQTGLVFGNLATGKPVDMKKAWSAAVEQAELEDFRFHDLRHHTASVLARNGATLRQLADQLGHKTLSQVQRYSHLTDEAIGGGASIIEAAIAQATKA